MVDFISGLRPRLLPVECNYPLVRDADQSGGLLHEVELRGGLHHAHSDSEVFDGDSRPSR